MARTEELRVFADEHDLAMISIAELIAFAARSERLVERVAGRPGYRCATASSPRGRYASTYDSREHIAFVFGEIGDGEGRVDPGALRVPDWRRLRLAALRLRAAAGRGAGRGGA
jgi:hypothetical protein